MTPKQKAIELVNKMSVVGLQMRNEGIQCALIAVDEIIEATSIKYEYNSDFELKITGKKPLQYWLDVKKEISML